MSEKYFRFRKWTNAYVKDFFCLPRNWNHLFQFFIPSYVYLKDIYKTVKGLGKIQFVSELTILLNPQILNFTGVFTKKKTEIIKAWKQLLVGKLTFVCNISSSYYHLQFLKNNV